MPTLLITKKSYTFLQIYIYVYNITIIFIKYITYITYLLAQTAAADMFFYL